MMSRTIMNRLFILVIGIGGLLSCQKEITGEDNLNPPVVVNDSNYLHKIYFLDSVVAGAKDTVRVVSYHYDNDKRVTQVTDSMEDVLGLLPVSIHTYYYNGSDTIPYKSMYQRYSVSIPASIDTQVTFHFYDASLKRVRDSVSDYTSSGTANWYVTHFLYSGNTITLQRNSIVFNTTQTDNRGNIIHGTNGDDEFEYQFDNRPSPFARLSNFRALQLDLGGEEFYDYYLLRNYNNYTRCTETYAGTQEYDYDYSNKYTYRADGYPVRRWIEEDPGYFSIELYTYRSF